MSSTFPNYEEDLILTMICISLDKTIINKGPVFLKQIEKFKSLKKMKDSIIIYKQYFKLVDIKHLMPKFSSEDQLLIIKELENV